MFRFVSLAKYIPRIIIDIYINEEHGLFYRLFTYTKI